MLSALLFVIAGFVAGGIPTGYWLARALKGIDIREHGSGSTGATNVWRCVGKPAGVAVFAIDVLKGFVPVALSIYMERVYFGKDWSGWPDMVPVMVAVTCLVGHSKSVFLKFQGGKSAATGLGTLLALCPPGGGMTFVTWLVVLFTSKIVSLASIIGVGTCGGWFALFHAPVPFVVYCVFGFIYVTWRHKANIKRMIAGTEPRIGDKPKDEQKGEPASSSSA